MTLENLKDEVAALAFEEGLTLSRAFIASANRALTTIFTERPVARTVKIYAADEPPTLHVSRIYHACGEAITQRLTGRAYSFRVCGKGSFTLTDGIVKSEKSFDTENGLFRGFLNTDSASISFEGEYAYRIFDLVCYGEIRSGEVEDIPEYTPTVSFDLNEKFGDFLAPLLPPRTKDGAMAGATLQNGTLTLPRGKYDEIYVTYARLPRKISADEVSREIDISGECAPLLSLLCAAYLWLDEDPEKAQYYMSVYKSEMSFIRRYNGSISADEYQDVTGWA